MADGQTAAVVEDAVVSGGDTLLTASPKEDAVESDASLLGEKLKEEGSVDKESETDGESKDKVESKDKAEVKDKSIPEKYEVKVPEGMNIDSSMMDTMTPVFKDLGLTGEQVQKLVDAYAPLVKSQVEGQQKAAIEMWKETTNTWREEAKKALGPNAAKEMSYAAKAIEKSGVKGLRELMDETGVGNALPLVQFFIWAGKQFSNDNFVDGSTRGVKDSGNFTDIYTHPTSKATLK